MPPSFRPDRPQPPRPNRPFRIGTAGWSIPPGLDGRTHTSGHGLRRYAAIFDAVEINSTFYRRHRPSTFARWVEETPEHFRFAVKLPRAITHDARLVGALDLAKDFRRQVEPLAAKLGPLLVQLPASLAFERAVAMRFFADLRRLWPEAIVCEPRHPSWFDAKVDAILSLYEVARVAADPAGRPSARTPAGWRGVSYWRLHGSPRMYASSYDDLSLVDLALHIKAAPGEAWCIFDNTMLGAAAVNAVSLQASLIDER